LGAQVNIFSKIDVKKGRSVIAGAVAPWSLHKANALSRQHIVGWSASASRGKSRIWLLRASMPLYFAYGSNMDVERLETTRLNPEGVHSTARSLGRLSDYKLVFNKPSAYFIGAGAANIEFSTGSHIYGTLNEMPEIGLTILDKYENVNLGQYERLVVRVKNLATNSEVFATTYISRNNNDYSLKPRTGYMQHMLSGADLLPQEWLEYLKAVPVLSEQAQ
jgi:hypothetical protein